MSATWVLLAGLPGSGKSTLAQALAKRLDAAVLDKDRVRAALFPGPFTDYSAPQDDLCIRAMIQAAAYLTRQGRVAHIFFDGRTFATVKQRAQVIRAAERAGASWRILHVQCTQVVAEARLAQDDGAHPARNRDLRLYHAVQQRFQPIPEPALVVDTSNGFADQLQPVLAWLR